MGRKFLINNYSAKYAIIIYGTVNDINLIGLFSITDGMRRPCLAASAYSYRQACKNFIHPRNSSATIYGLLSSLWYRITFKIDIDAFVSRIQSVYKWAVSFFYAPMDATSFRRLFKWPAFVFLPARNQKRNSGTSPCTVNCPPWEASFSDTHDRWCNDEKGTVVHFRGPIGGQTKAEVAAIKVVYTVHVCIGALCYSTKEPSEIPVGGLVNEWEDYVYIAACRDRGGCDQDPPHLHR